MTSERLAFHPRKSSVAFFVSKFSIIIINDCFQWLLNILQVLGWWITLFLFVFETYFTKIKLWMNVNTIAKVHLRFKKHLFLYLCSFEILEHLHSRLLNLKTSPLTFFFKTWIQTNKTSNLPSIYHRKWFQQFFIRQSSGCVACGS